MGSIPLSSPASLVRRIALLTLKTLSRARLARYIGKVSTPLSHRLSLSLSFQIPCLPPRLSLLLLLHLKRPISYPTSLRCWTLPGQALFMRYRRQHYIKWFCLIGQDCVENVTCCDQRRNVAYHFQISDFISSTYNGSCNRASGSC